MNKKLLPVLMLLASVPVFAAPDARVESVLRDKTRAARLAQFPKKHEVALSFQWEKKNYFKRSRFRIGGPVKPILLSVDKKETACAGVLAEGRVITVRRCAEGKKGFELRGVTMRFSNGQKARAAAGAVVRSGDFAFVPVPARLVHGLDQASVAVIPEGAALEDSYGGEVRSAVLDFFFRHGVLSARAGRSPFGIKRTLRVGQPFYYQGKVVALCAEVPSRLPVGLFASAEDSLAVFRADNGAAVLK